MNRKQRRKQIAAELELVARASRGRLDPKRVVAWARANRRSSLHSCFQWNDGKAAEAYRIWQARELIVSVEVVYRDGKRRQSWVSPVTFRGRGGYCRLVDVMDDTALRAGLLAQALAELEAVCAKYEDLCELAGVRAAVRLIRQGQGRAA